MRLSIAALVPLVISLAVAACDKKNDAKPGGAGTAPSSAASGGGGGEEIGLNDGSFVVAAQPPTSCAPGATCTVPIKLEAQGEFHINDEYPYKFLANNATGAELEGSDPQGKNVFSKAAGDFAKQSPKIALMNVKLKPTSPGKATVSGTYKFSVCAESKCKIETAPVSFSVDVK